jgi:outer membrane receptor protein involved in Fe transport
LSNTRGRVPFAVVSDDAVGETELGIYSQNSTAWSDWFRTIAGVRMDAVRMSMTSANLPENDGHASGQRVSPKFSAILGPFCKTEFFANIGKGFHSNDARGVIDRIDPATREPVPQVPALVASLGKEVGLRTEIIPGLQSSLAIWSLDSNSEIVYDADSAIGSTSPNGASKRRGVEWNNHVRANDWLLFDADLAWTRARYASQNDNGQLGDEIPNAVGKVGSFTVTAQPAGAWSGEWNTRYIGAYPLSQDGSLAGPSAIVTNLRVQRRLSPNLALSLDVLNLFNRAYYDIAYEQDYQTSPSSAVVPEGVTVHPGEPRELRLTLKAQF